MASYAKLAQASMGATSQKAAAAIAQVTAKYAWIANQQDIYPFPLSVVCWRSLVRASTTGASVHRHQRQQEDERLKVAIRAAHSKTRPDLWRIAFKLSWPPRGFTLGGTGLGDCAVKWGCLANKAQIQGDNPFCSFPARGGESPWSGWVCADEAQQSGPVISPILPPTKAGFIWLVSGCV